jgi:hypothetical protein
MERCIDGRKDAGHVGQNVVIPEAQYTVAIGFEILRTHLVGRAAGMLTTIDLNDDFGLMRCEVGEIRTYRRLAPKVMRLERGLPQMLPELLFGLGRVTSQSPGAWHTFVNSRLRSSWHAPPTPDPSPPRASRAGGGEQISNRRIDRCTHQGHQTALPASVWTQASPQAFASSRTRMM